ncbi:hypothetical protein RZS28_10040 [Methylocapsa polymorpha]|uniref:Uncharacterized protein n=1 Tax=Methylocapsa polymorpha TaxID=3080828 RepID=A0ABZ0HLM6_9HYPH|nr:hypothetical protein RZS28_10040 [Methylocapsa sp. RX1]
MIGLSRLVGASVLAVVLLGARAEAQDSSLMDMNMDMGCMLMAGMHELRVAAYSYSSDSREDVCADIPAPGPVSITLNAISKELRDMAIEVRVVRNAEADVAPGDNLDSVTLAHLPPKTYPTGVVTFPVTFDKPGKYAVLVTVRGDKDMVMSGLYVMTVEQGARQWIFVLIFAIAAVGAAVGFYVWDEHRKKLKLSVKSS